jgi:hypothetical protein
MLRDGRREDVLDVIHGDPAQEAGPLHGANEIIVRKVEKLPHHPSVPRLRNFHRFQLNIFYLRDSILTYNGIDVFRLLLGS